MPEVLYNSRAIRAKIRTLLANPEPSDRRVVLVAYLGKDYADFLPDPAGIEIICSPTAGATSASAVDGLIRAKATVWFSDKLHMKIYWSRSRGCIVTSANLSANALGVKGLKEAGVWIEPGTVDIDRLIAEAQAYAVKDKRLERLRIEGEKHRRAMAAVGKPDDDDGFQYLDWFAHSIVARTAWKVGDYIGDTEIPPVAKKILKTTYGKDEPANYLGVAKKRLLREGDWVLQFEYDHDKTPEVLALQWMTVDFVSPSAEDPFIAIQAHSLKKYERPPFLLTSQFKKAFKLAVSTRAGKFVNLGSLSPSEAFLNEIADQLHSL